VNVKSSGVWGEKKRSVKRKKETPNIKLEVSGGAQIEGEGGGAGEAGKSERR